jgi:hypothetical protein
MAQRRRSYAWANRTHVANIPLSELTETAYEGLEYAIKLADQARLWSNQNLLSHTPETAEAPFTLEQLAHDRGIPASTMRSRIAAARWQLFGDLSDAAISKRAHRRRKPPFRPNRPTRTCKEPGCSQQLPANAHGNQHYCDQHRGAAARTRRHRRPACTASVTPAEHHAL